MIFNFLSVNFVVSGRVNSLGSSCHAFNVSIRISLVNIFFSIILLQNISCKLFAFLDIFKQEYSLF